MSEPDDPIRRSSDLGPPDRAEIIALHILTMLVMEKPRRLAKVLNIAQDGAQEARVLRLHARDGDPEWRAAFRGAAVRIEGAAAMLLASLEVAPKPKKGKKKQT